MMSIQSLYKYGRINEKSESLFSTGNVWFSSPSSLNDPFECKPWFEFNGTKEQIIDVLIRVLHRNNPTTNPVDTIARAHQIYAEGRHTDPRIWSNLRRYVSDMLQQNIGIYCLTSSNSNILMWSHYADEHKGYCLEFAASDTTPFFGEAQKVNYSNEFPVVDFFETPHDKQVDLIFLTKFIGWHYEEEHRIIDHQLGPGLRSYPPELLKSVTFGLRMPEQDRAAIRQWLKQRQCEVLLYEATIDRREFKIEVQEIM